MRNAHIHKNPVWEVAWLMRCVLRILVHHINSVINFHCYRTLCANTIICRIRRPLFRHVMWCTITLVCTMYERSESIQFMRMAYNFRLGLSLTRSSSLVTCTPHTGESHSCGHRLYRSVSEHIHTHTHTRTHRDHTLMRIDSIGLLFGAREGYHATDVFCPKIRYASRNFIVS